MANKNFLKGRKAAMLKGDIVSQLIKEKECFFNLISADENITTDVVSGTKDPAEVEVCRIKEVTTFSQMFGELNADTKKLSFSCKQAKNFVKKNRNWLQADEYSTLLLVEYEGYFFVIFIYSYFGGSKIDAILHEFESDHVCSAGSHRIVIPWQMA